ncbi:E3 ISG15--protein ligase HERC5-like isoform X1 [Alosa sapidissima]|uniref:E3 ISG15--protein ligase HERC5-like isoform X1 n=1 Tax=Alosa sapidissima TaxID=34773 RepID=UPI001C095BA5|nr:E3 ISG15--protein ligase HERC5-like isoform X1 [Alosa sapidissima]
MMVSFGFFSRFMRLYTASPVSIGTSTEMSVSMNRSAAHHLASKMSLFTWGAHADRGLTKSDSVDIQDAIHFVRSQNKIRYVSSGRTIVAFLRGEGKLSIFRMQEEEDGSSRAGKLKNFNDVKEIDLVCCGETTAVLILSGGKALSLDRFNKLRPLEVLHNKRIAQIVCGNQHSLALTEDGQVFTWGQNSNGQLGLGKGEPSTMSPQPLKSLAGIPLSQISAGGDHSFALSVSGAVFGWGKNSAGQLGLGNNIDCPEPVQITALNMKKIVHISCGEDHTAVLTKDGVVFTCGSGRYGQLGHNSFRDELRPRLVAELWGSKVSQIACGRHHTLVLVGDSNAILAFGRGEQGQLGNGQRTNSSVPLYVHFPPDHEETFGKITAGGHLSFAFCQAQSDPAKPHPTKSKGLLTLDIQTVESWVSGSKASNKINKDICRIFASASCINGSFIDTSSDKHYLTSIRNSGLDLSLARLAFEKMAEKHTVLTEVESVVQQHLLPSLSPSPAGVEGLRVYLILPELLRVLLKQHRGTDLAVSLAEAILRLHPDSLKALETLWSTLPGSYLRTVLKVFRTMSGKAFAESVNNASDHGQPLQLTQVLQRVHEAIRRGKRRIPDQCFFVKEVNSVFKELNARLIGLNQPHVFWDPLCQKQQVSMQNTMALYKKNIFQLKSSPCIFNLEGKHIVLNLHLQHMRANETSCFLLNLRRTALLEDAFSQLQQARTHDLRKYLGVQYMENNVQLKISDVDKRDFFLNVFRELYHSEMFMYNDTETLVWFPSQPREEVKKYFLFGMLCGLALYNDSVVHLPFPSALFKKLLNIPLTLEDLAEISSVAKSLQEVLDYDDVESMGFFFSISWDNIEVELDPNEAGKPVTNSNKKEFVQAYVDYILNKSVEKVFEEFKRGFFKVCARDVVELFHPEELRGMMVGREDYDWDKLKQNASYEFGFYENHPTIVLFWEVFQELSEDDKKAFLLFLTGFDRVPILGMQQIKMRVQVLPNSTPDHLPEALTCHALLMLHPYQCKEVLRTRLSEALHHRRGFWED